MAIIALTQHVGTRAFELGQLTAERLDYRFLTADQLIAQASQAFKVSPEQLVIVDERRPHFWERLKTDTQRVVTFFRAALFKEMAANNLVVVGRSVTYLVSECGCGVSVRLTGPFKERAQLIAQEEGLSEAVAERRVRDYDREVRARVQTLFNYDLDDPANFSLVLNTFAMPLGTAALVLSALAIELDRITPPERWARMRDAVLEAQIRAALMFHPKIGHAPVEVRCVQGAVQINGPGLVPPWDDLVNEVVSQVEGVTSVRVVADEQPMTVRPA